jgi:TusA-related sulfurtransferase
MIETMPPIPVAMTIVDTRGAVWPSPLRQLMEAALVGWVGETIAVRLADRAALAEINAWIRAEGHGLIGLYERHGFDEVIVEIRH